jgi:hypothetical protein
LDLTPRLRSETTFNKRRGAFLCLNNHFLVYIDFLDQQWCKQTKTPDEKEKMTKTLDGFGRDNSKSIDDFLRKTQTSKGFLLTKNTFFKSRNHSVNLVPSGIFLSKKNSIQDVYLKKSVPKKLKKRKKLCISKNL